MTTNRLAYADDHADLAVRRILDFCTKERIEALARIAVGQIQEIEDAAFAVREAYMLGASSVARGTVLDLLGAIIGEPRTGRTDDVYEIAIRTKIAILRSNGTGADLVAILDATFDDLAWVFEDLSACETRLTLADTVTEATTEFDLTDWTKTRCTYSGGVLALTSFTNSSAVIQTAINDAESGVYEFRARAEAIEIRYLLLQIYNYDGLGIVSTITFDLYDGTIVKSSGLLPVGAYSVEVTSGVYDLVVRFVWPDKRNFTIQIYPSYSATSVTWPTGNGQSCYLSDVSLRRISTDAQLVDTPIPVPDLSTWIPIRATFVDGALVANDSVNTNHHAYVPSTDVATENCTIRMRVVAKSDGGVGRYISIGALDSYSLLSNPLFDLQAGVVSLYAGYRRVGYNEIEDLGDGWFACETRFCPTQATFGPRIYLCTQPNTTTCPGSVEGATIYIRSVELFKEVTDNAAIRQTVRNVAKAKAAGVALYAGMPTSTVFPTMRYDDADRSMADAGTLTTAYRGGATAHAGDVIRL